MALVSARSACHSPHMDPRLDELTRLCPGLRPGRPTVPMYSTALPDPRASTGKSGEPSGAAGSVVDTVGLGQPRAVDVLEQVVLRSN